MKSTGKIGVKSQSGPSKCGVVPGSISTMKAASSIFSCPSVMALDSSGQTCLLLLSPFYEGRWILGEQGGAGAGAPLVCVNLSSDHTHDFLLYLGVLSINVGIAHLTISYLPKCWREHKRRPIQNNVAHGPAFRVWPSHPRIQNPSLLLFTVESLLVSSKQPLIHTHPHPPKGKSQFISTQAARDKSPITETDFPSSPYHCALTLTSPSNSQGALLDLHKKNRVQTWSDTGHTQMFPCFWRSLDVITGKRRAEILRYNAWVRGQARRGRKDASTSPLAGSCAKVAPEMKVGHPQKQGLGEPPTFTKCYTV